MTLHWTYVLFHTKVLYSKNLSIDSSLSCQLCPKQSLKRWEKVLRNFFSSPTPWLYHTLPKPCFNSSSFTLPAQDTLPLSTSEISEPFQQFPLSLYPYLRGVQKRWLYLGIKDLTEHSPVCAIYLSECFQNDNLLWYKICYSLSDAKFSS